MEQKIRNFGIIAHIDHGKSTLADRLLEFTGTISKREMQEQLLDQMDIERERGITVKLQPVRMQYQDHQLNLIDTPGHVDFTYEVSRSLAAVEGVLLLVDASQGIQAQTLANLYLALDQDLVIIPVINKIDLPNANVDKVKKEIINLLGCDDSDILLTSAKTGQGIEDVLKAVIDRIPEPQVDSKAPLQALIFDSVFDEYRGAVAYVRVIGGQINKGDKLKFMTTGKEIDALEVGYFKPKYVADKSLKSGEIGYLVTGLKDLQYCRVGDTLTSATQPADKPLPGYKEAKPMVYAGVFCKNSDDFPQLRKAIEKLKLNDAALVYENENSPVLGFGFRCGFLGLLHLEIFQERLQREYNLDLIVTVPSVNFKVTKTNGEVEMINNPAEFPDASNLQTVEEPIMKVDIVAHKDYLGAIMQLVQEKRGIYKNTEYLNDDIALLHYQVPLTQVIVDFYDKLKSVSSGYASLNYEFDHWQEADMQKMDILVAEEPVESLAIIVYKDTAHSEGKRMVNTLKEHIPRQMFRVKIQAAIGGKVIASEQLSALRKDVTAKLYGGDWSRRQKLLEKQKKGKKKMESLGKVEIPTKAYLAVLKK